MLKEEEPLVSIIVITYNSSKYVLETLESAKAQTYQNIELIVSDDCSTDDTVELCQKWIDNNGTRFLRAELVTSEKNRGIPANCNQGFKASKGEWVKFIAGDDTLIQTCIENNVEIINKNRLIEVLQTNCNLYQDNFENKNFIRASELEMSQIFSQNLSGFDQYQMLLHRNFISAPSIFLKKSLLEKFNGFDEEFMLIEDFPFWLMITKAGNKIYINNQITVNYRIHSSSVIKQNKLYMSSLYAKELLNLQHKYVRKNVGFFTYYIRRTRYYIIVSLDEFGLNNNSFISKIIYQIVFKIF